MSRSGGEMSNWTGWFTSGLVSTEGWAGVSCADAGTAGASVRNNTTTKAINSHNSGPIAGTDLLFLIDAPDNFRQAPMGETTWRRAGVARGGVSIGRGYTPV